ncbi:MAG: MMPL family transporter [Pirellulales bacterium]|nr:MMPL family transporter [Pirellulales bacterium]
MKPSFFTRYCLVILAIAAFAMPFLARFSRLAVESRRNDVRTWLPDHFPETTAHAWFESHFPDEQFVLASWDGCTLDDPRLETMARKLETIHWKGSSAKERPLFKRVLTGARLIREAQEPFEDLSKDELIQRLSGSLIGPDGKQTCVVGILAETLHGKDLREAIEVHFKQAAFDSGITLDPKDKEHLLHLGGPPVDNAAIDYEGERTLFRLAAWSVFVGLGISWLCFRSVRLTLMVFLCALLSAGVGMTIVYLTGGLVDAILFSMPSLVFVLSLSGAIHIVNYYHDAIHEEGLDGAADRAVAHAWKPCSVAAITTALGLISLCTSNLLPIRNFGFYAALGVLGSLLILFLVLPAMLAQWPSRAFARQAEEEKSKRSRSEEIKPTAVAQAWQRIGETVIRRRSWVALGCTAAMVLFALGIPRIETSIKLMKLFSPEARILADYAWLEKRLGPLVPMEVVVRLDRDKCHLSFAQRMRLARDVEDAIEYNLAEVGGALSAATYVPDLGPTDFRRDMNDILWSNELKKYRSHFADFLQVDEETNEELWRVSARVEALGDLDYGEFVNDIRNVVEPICQEYRDEGFDGIKVTYTGLVPLVYKAQTQLLTGLFWSLIMAFGLIAVVMILVLRSLSAGVLSMIPNLFPVVVIFGMMGWLDILVDVGSMMTASVALGVAVDDTIHYLSWFRHAMDEGHDRKGAALYAYGRCATAMTQTTVIGGLGLAVFALSTFTPTQRFGYLMLTLLIAALFGDLIYLPSLLCGPLGRFFGRSPRRRRAGSPDDDGETGLSGEPLDAERLLGEPAPANETDTQPATLPLRPDGPRRSARVS